MESLFQLISLSVFSTASAAVVPHYNVMVTKGHLSARVLLHDNDGAASTSESVEESKGFCSSCITQQESLFYYHRRTTSEASMVMHELSFGSYARIAGDLLSSYSVPVDDNDSTSHSFFSFFGSADRGRSTSLAEPTNFALFSISVSDDDAMSLVKAFRR